MSNTYATMARHPLRFFALTALAAIVLGMLFAGRANADLSPSVFELDGNTLVNNAPAHDWSQVFSSGTFGSNGADKALFTPDFFPGDDDQPSTGATKDTNDMDKWDCKDAGLSPPKNDMANAFVASYTVNGRQLIYFGLDRINSDNGNANVGFWFLKGNHDCDGDGTGKFTGGKHSKGDTLVTSEFTGGGSVSTINVFEWCSDPAAPDLKCGSSTSVVEPTAGKGDGPLQLVFTGADCRNPDGTPSAFATGLACATVNRTVNTESPPWPYIGAGTPSDTYERGALFEGGIDATGLNLDLICTGTFLADTRSSQSPTAQLHDFSIGQVDLCSVSVATQSSTTASNVVPGTQVSDTATFTKSPSNAPAVTGSVKFFLCGPGLANAANATTGCATGGTQIGAAKNVSADSATSDQTSSSQTLGIGLYCWRAEYTPDAASLYSAVSHTNSTSECFTTVKQPSNTVTDANPDGSAVVPGTSVSDTATVTGGAGQPVPTGSVKFFLCQPATVITNGGDCSAGGDQVGTPASGETLNASGVATSESSANTTAIGKYCWRAEYSGDAFYVSSSHTNGLTATTGGVTPECFETLKQPSNTATDANPDGSAVVPGTSVTDTATVTGGTGQPVPTGSVKFFLCQPATVTANGGDCSAGGDQVGTPESGETLNASGVATSESSTNTTTIGKYCWRAEYSGDSFYLPSSHTNSLTATTGGVTPECFITAKQPSNTATNATPAGSGVLTGMSVSDTATVTGGAGQPVPTGKVKFFLCQPATVTANGGDCSAGGDQVGTPADGETLDASGVATSDAATNTTTVGKYCWRAEYSGDSFYLPSSHTNGLTVTTGGVTPECFVTFRPSTLVSFTDQIVGLPADATGTVTYEVFLDSECTQAAPNSDITPSSNDVLPGGVAPSSDSYTPPAPGGTFYILATFTGNGAFTGATFVSCEESVVITH